MKIQTSIVFFLLIITNPLIAGNTMTLEGDSVQAGDTITIKIKINNDDAFVAFQSDMALPAQLKYVKNSASLNSERATDHTLSASLLEGDTLRLFGYSNNNSSFSGNSGTVASFKLTAGSVPGDYTLPLNNALIGDASSNNILTGKQTYPVTILTPDISLSTDSLDFGEIPMEDSLDKQITINNKGNQQLKVTDINSNNPRFSVDDSVFTIAASSQKTLTIHYKAVKEEDTVSSMIIKSNDPDEANSKVKNRVYAFAVNELHTGSFTAFSGNQASLSFSVNNMEKFTGLQFDVDMPEVLSYVDGSASLSQRSDDHSVTVNRVSDNELRVVAYSQSNAAFKEDSGDVVHLDFMVNGTGGNYSLNLNDVIIGDSTGENILSDYYNNNITIAAPDLNGNSTLNFGEVDITDQPVHSYSIENTGEDTLIIDDINFSSGNLAIQETLPDSIMPDSTGTLSVSFNPESEGRLSETMQIRSNDPDEDPWVVTIEGNVFMPNYMYVRDTLARSGDTVGIKIVVDNYEQFVGFQFDLSFPSFINCLADKVKLTSRAGDHSLEVSRIDPNTIRAFAYSMNNDVFSGKEGPVITIPMHMDTTGGGIFDITLSNTLLGNENSEDILYESRNGQLSVSDLTISEVNTKPVKCYGTSSGQIEIHAEGSATPLSYSIDNGNSWQSDSVFSNLNSGNYTIRVKDNKGAVISYSQNPIIFEQPVELVIDSVNYDNITGCYGDANGSISISASGGSGKIEFSLDGGSTWQKDSVFTGLEPGEYNITIRDTNLCITNYSNNPILLTQPDKLSIDSLKITHVTGSAGNNNGSIAIATSGGTGELSYSIDSGATWQTDSIFNNLSAGDYNVAVKDTNGCINYFTNNPAQIAEPGELIISSVNLTHITGCYGDATGKIDIKAKGGVGALQYTIDGGSTWQSDSIFTGLTAGEYNLQVKDQNTNIADYINNPVVLKQPPKLVIDSVNYEHINGCQGNLNGSITIAYSGGSGTIEFSVDGGSTWYTDSVFTGLEPGEYFISIRDKNLCTTNYSNNPITLIQTNQLTIDSINISHITGESGNSNGSIAIAASGGTGELSYSIDSGSTWQTDSTFNNLSAGDYNVAVKDVNGCIIYFVNNPLHIAEPGELIISSVDMTHITGCYGDESGEISINAKGGDGALKYSIDGGTSWQSDGLFTGLAAGEYTIQVKDENTNITNYVNNPVVLQQPAELVIDSVKSQNVTGCYGDANGSIAIASSGGTGPFEYSADDGSSWQTDSIFSGLAEGRYNVALKDDNGCSVSYASNPVVIDGPEPFHVDITASPDSSVCGDQEIELDATHPAAESYSWSPSGKTGATITVDSSGIGYNARQIKVTATDTNGCRANDEIQVEFVNCTGITVQKRGKLNVYPNPSSGKFSVECNDNTQPTRVSLYNSIGEMIRNKKLSENNGKTKTQLQFSGVSEGIYLLRIETNQGFLTKRVIIK
jgi:hypothetical protein